jgi:hypothetical protein
LKIGFDEKILQPTKATSSSSGKSRRRRCCGRSAPLEKKKTLIVQEHTISIWNNFYS